MYEIYKATSAALELRMDPPDPGIMTFSIVLDGVVDGQHVHVRRVVGSGGYLVVESTWLTPLGAELSVSRGGLVDALLDLAGARDLQIGDDIFDGAFRVKAKDPDLARRILREEVRNALLQLGGKSTLTDRSVQARFHHGEESFELLTQTCHAVALVAKLVQVVEPRTAYR